MRTLTLLLLVAMARAEPPQPYAQRVDEFWAWFGKNGAAIHKAIGDGKAPEWAGRIGARLRGVHPGVNWELCPVPGKGVEGLCFYPTNRADAFLAKHWLAAAPKMDGWRFFDHLPPSTRKRIRIGGVLYADTEFVVQIRNGIKHSVFDLRVFHPRFAKLKSEDRFRVAFIWLDGVLGSRAMTSRVGELLMATKKPSGTARHMGELHAELARRCEELGWTLSPDSTEAAVGGSIPEAEEKDVFGGWHLLERSEWDDLKRQGTIVATLMITNPQGETAGGRVVPIKQLQQAMREVLGSSAYLIGAGYGTKTDATHLLVFDWPATVAALKPVLEKHKELGPARLIGRTVKRESAFK